MYEVRKTLLYTREETDSSVTIVWNSAYTIAMYAFLGGFIAFTLLLNTVFGAVGMMLSYLCLALLLMQWVYSIFTYWKPRREMNAALKAGRATVSGSHNSLKKPLTAVILKTAPILK